MATKSTTKATTSPEPTHADAVQHHEHPSDWQYIKIAIILAVVTAVEVVLYYKELPGRLLNNSALGILAVVKFVIVVLYFMHLKFDSRLLRRLFVSGVVLAMFCYIAYLRTLGIWG